MRPKPVTSDWIEYVSPANGQAPPDWDHGTVQYRSRDLGWRDSATPYIWLEGVPYRYHPLAPLPSAPPPTVSGPLTSLPESDAARLEYPMFDGLVAYFPNALAEVSKVSKIGNDQHNPGQPLHWARGKSTDHENKIMRHLVDAGRKDARGVRHTARLAWRALAMLQEELEREEGAPLSRGSRAPE